MVVSHEKSGNLFFCLDFVLPLGSSCQFKRRCSSFARARARWRIFAFLTVRNYVFWEVGMLFVDTEGIFIGGVHGLLKIQSRGFFAATRNIKTSSLTTLPISLRWLGRLILIFDRHMVVQIAQCIVTTRLTFASWGVSALTGMVGLWVECCHRGS